MISLLIMKNEFVRSLKNKKKLILTFLLPLISIIIAIGVNNLMKPSVNIGIIENKYSSEEFKDKVENEIDSINRINLAKAHKETINTDMILAKYVAVVEFKGNNKFKIYSLDKDVKNTLNNAFKESINLGTTKQFENLSDDLDNVGLSALERSSGFIFMMMIITCTMSSAVIIKDKKEKILLRYSATSNKLSKYIIGNYLYNILNTFMQILFSALVLMILPIDMGISINKFLTIGLVIAVSSASLATLIAVLSNSELQASLIASSFSLIVSLLGGAFLPVEKMPNLLKSISDFTITKWIINLTDNIQNNQSNSISMILLIMIVSIVVGLISSKIGEKRLKYQ